MSVKRKIVARLGLRRLSARLVFDEDREKLWDVAMAQRTRDL
jgi:hypothetical protein